MPYAPDCCGCDRTGICTTRWYPLQGVSYFGNPADAYVYDFGGGTTRLAITEFEGQFYTWILGGTTGSDTIAKVQEPDGGHPVAAWKKKIEYYAPEGAVGIDSSPIFLEINEMRTVGKDADSAVVLGTRTKTGLVHPINNYVELAYGPDILEYDISPYQGNQGVIEELAAENVVCKLDIGYRSNPQELITEQISTGGFFRLGITQFLPGSVCGAASFSSEDSEDGSISWSNPIGALDDDGSYALASGENEESHYLAGQFNLSDCVPDDAVSVAGITVQIKRFASDDSATVWVKDSQVKIRVSDGTLSPFSENKADSGKWPTSSSIQNYGGASDLWGLTITGLEILVRTYLSVEFGNNGVDAFVDQVSVVVTYLDGNGDPINVTVNDLKANQIPEGNGTTNSTIGPSVAVFRNANSTPGHRFGFYTDYLTEVFSLDATGEEVAAAIQPYLDPVYTVEGEGTISATSKITLTFTHDGSLDNVYDSGGNYWSLDGEGHWYIAVRGPTPFPNEAPSIHMLKQDGTLRWSRCSSQTELRFRGTNKIEYDPDNEIISVPGGGFWTMNQWSIDGEMQDHGAYIAGPDHTLFIRLWRLIDREGYAYSQYGIEQGRTSGDPYIDLALVKWGPSGQDAALNQIWSVDLTFAIQHWTVTDDAIVCGGLYPGDGQVKVALITLDGAVGWEVDIPANGGGTPRGLTYLNDIWTDKDIVVVSAYHGAYMLDYDTGTLTAYFPHGGPCRSAMRLNNPGGDDYLVLTGGGWEIDIDPIEFDIDPETLT